MSNEVQQLENEVKEYKLQLETVQSGLQADPDNVELQNLQTELEEVISLTETAIAELKPASAPAGQARKSAAAAPLPLSPKEKWSKENHPAYQAGYRKPGESVQNPTADEASSMTQNTFSVNDSVLAKWKSGDKSFYPARITSITGSSTNPVYIVTFKNYSTTETLSAHDIRPLSNEKKRKADGTPVAGSGGSASGGAVSSNVLGATSSGLPGSGAGTPTGTNSGGSTNVISAAASINPTLASQAKREPSKVSDGPIRPAKVPRKVKANRELEAGKTKWQDFTTKGKMGKGGKKDSMFRTPEGVNARVGFTGSGQEMRKDPTRSRHIYQQGGEDEL